MIDIIIPAFNAHKTIERTLLSIAIQKNIKNIKVYIVNDASKKDYKEQINKFKSFMNITELSLSKNCGPGVARRYGMENSNSEYVMFIDADDILYNPNAVNILYNKIKRNQLDVVISPFYEVLENGELIEHEDDFIWLHGKIYRRRFLEDNNITFNDTYSNEDNGFNRLVFLHSSKKMVINDYTYMWIYEKNSITRKNDYEYDFSSLSGYIYNMTWALNKAIESNCSEKKIADLTYNVILSVYYYYLNYIDREEVEKLLKESKRLYEIYRLYPIKSKNQRKKIKKEQYDYQINYLDEEKINSPVIDFGTFLNLLKNI